MRRVMTLPPWWGPPAEGATAPDPIIWWFIAPVIAYVLAIWLAGFLAYLINDDTLNTQEKEDDS